jgi:hypothetical protein
MPAFSGMTIKAGMTVKAAMTVKAVCHSCARNPATATTVIRVRATRIDLAPEGGHATSAV